MQNEVKEAIARLGEGGFKEGSNLQKARAYHDVPLPGYEELQTHRNGNASRVDYIVGNDLVDVRELHGLDIGCAIGGISLGLAYSADCNMVGVDYDENVVRVGNTIAKAEDLDCKFLEMDVHSDRFTSLVADDGFDFVVWFSNWMWIAKVHGKDFAYRLLQYVSENVPVMFFDSSQGPGDGMAGEWSLGKGVKGVKEALAYHTDYSHIVDLGSTPGWRGRHMFVCAR